MEWSIQQLARAVGTTSRTLRHYDDTGLLPPSRTGHNGYRYYDEAALLRLQRILLLRELGLGLAAIGEVLAGERDSTAALRVHLADLEQRRTRLERQIASVRTTLDRTDRGEQLVVTDMFDGFDHTQHRDEVVRHWGQSAYDTASKRWSRLSEAERQDFHQRQRDITADFAEARRAGLAPDSDEVRDIARRHCAWLAVTTEPTKEYLIGLGQLYVDDPRFTAVYDQHAEGTAELIRDALKVFAEENF